MKKIRSMIKLMMEDGVNVPSGFMVSADEAEYIKLYKKDIRGKHKVTVNPKKIYNEK